MVEQNNSFLVEKKAKSRKKITKQEAGYNPA